MRYTSVKDAISIVDFIEHTPLSAQFSSDEELFGELATTIKSVHALPLFPPLVGFLDGVDGFIERYSSLPDLPVVASKEHFHYYAHIQRVYPRRDVTLVSSHNDLNPTNILHNDGKIWIIDWEAAFANDPYVDLALVNIFFGSGERGEAPILATYFGEALTDYHRARFFLMQQVCFMYITMLFTHLASSTFSPIRDSELGLLRLQEFHMQLRSGAISMTSPQDYWMYAKTLLNESLSQMKTARFTEAIKLIESHR